MNAKKTFVTLRSKDGGATQDFEALHAERILRMPGGGGWELPQGGEYEFDRENGIHRRANKGKDKEQR